MLKKCQSEQIKFWAFGERNSHFPFLKSHKRWLAPNEVNLVYIDVLNLNCAKYVKDLSIGENEVSCVCEDEIPFCELKIALNMTCSKWSKSVLIDVLSFICTKYSKEMSIGEIDVFSVLEEKITFFELSIA
jgi:hypothetical protein